MAVISTSSNFSRFKGADGENVARVTLESVNEISVMSPDLNKLIVRARGETKSRNFNDSSDDIIVGLKLLASHSVLPDVNIAVLTSSKDFISGKG